MSKLKYKKSAIYLTVIFFLLLFVLVLFPLDKHKIFKPVSQAIYDKDNKLLRAFLSSDEKWRLPVKLNEVSKYLIKAVIATEDRYFYYHPGVNPWAIVRAIYLNVKYQKIISGGSTITMQVARMMEHRERTIPSKILEVFRALKLEFLYSKNKILELYFNIAPYGGNIEGVGAACYYYFQKSPSEISLAQAALLAAIPNSPQQLHPVQFPERIKKKRDNILKKLRDRKLITEKEYSGAIKESINIENTGIPFETPHFTDFVHTLYPKKNRIYTTLDRNIQTKCNNILTRHLKKWRNIGITNAAVVVIDNKYNCIRALIGSYDFFDEINSGQVNGAISPRSPGSTLKPLLYALAIDKGLLTPASILYDIPVSYAGYTPENFDEKYHGIVTLKEALIKSLNVPAANLLAKIGTENFLSFLMQGGISTINPKEMDYGLSMILGGCDVKLIELTNLFSAFANGGVYRSLKFCQDESSRENTRIISDGAAYIITELLSEVVRPDLPAYWDYSIDRPKIAWKTGTSYNHRDAWGIGYSKGFTIGIWAGNFDGQGIHELTGASVAGPILFDIFNAITGIEESKWFEVPASVSSRKVCALSGMVPNEDCPQTIDELYLVGNSPVGKCNIHKAFYIDNISGCRLLKSDLSQRVYKIKVFEIWSSEVATWMKLNGYPLDKIPPLLHASKKVMAGKGPNIRIPNSDCEYHIRPGVPVEHQKILLAASVENSVNRIFWFLDSKLIWSGQPGEKVFVCPEKGEHNLVCQDDHGRSTSMKFIVR
jgi:penicillin-binding protein 1C